MKKFSQHKSVFLILIVFLILLAIYFSLSKQGKEFMLNAQFTCPENLTKEESEAYLSKFTEFYITNYPDITFDDFLSRRMQQLVSNKCTVTLQNLANQNNGSLPDQESVNELKNSPYGENNKKLRELDR